MKKKQIKSERKVKQEVSAQEKVRGWFAKNCKQGDKVNITDGKTFLLIQKEMQFAYSLPLTSKKPQAKKK